MNIVRDQYEAYPYPTRDPDHEKHRLIMSPAYTLAAIDHLVFGGRRDWAQPFRVLIAGGGTGDAAIGIAQQMAEAGVPGEVVYLDLSSASRRITEERAKVRRLANIVFQTGSLLDLAPETNGLFDFINCIGVLHHLEDPAAGLRALTAVLAQGGGMNLMVYAALGRTGVYPAQAMLRSIAPAALPSSERIAIARRLLADLPPSNWLMKSPHIGDHRLGETDAGDAGIFDLLLHSVDRSYSISEFDRLIRGEGLRITGVLQSSLYDPGIWCKDPVILERVRALAPIAKAEFAENLIGIIKQHIVFVTRAGNSVVPPVITAGSVLVWTENFIGDAPDQAITINISFQETKVSAVFDLGQSKIIRLINNRRTVEEIWRASQLDEATFRGALARVWLILNGAGLVFIRDH